MSETWSYMVLQFGVNFWVELEGHVSYCWGGPIWANRGSLERA
jgi:hypothetical protein